MLDFCGGSGVKNPPPDAGHAGLIPGSGRSPEEGDGNPFQYSGQGSHGQRSLVGYSLKGHRKVRHDLMTKQQQ